jgi:hypothetical protein
MQKNRINVRYWFMVLLNFDPSPYFLV